MASGTGGVMYNGSYYYHGHNSDIVVRYQLQSGQHTKRQLADMAYRDCDRLPNQEFIACNTSDRHTYLYALPHNFADFAIDENGLWVVYVDSDSDSLVVTKLAFEVGVLEMDRSVQDLYIVDTWHLRHLNATSFANTFIMCGILYGVESASERKTRIAYAYDLYNRYEIDVGDCGCPASVCR